MFTLFSDTMVEAVMRRNMQGSDNSVWKYHVLTQILCLTLASVLFFMRCYVRLGFSRMKRQWLLEDWVLLVSFIGFLASSAILSVIMNLGGGIHIWDLKSEQSHRVLQFLWTHSVLYGPFIMTIKIAILLMYLRLLVPTRYSPLWFAVQIFLAIIFLFYTATTLAKIFMCDPIPRAWDKTIPGRCLNFPVLLLYTGTFNILSDVLIVLLPIKSVLGLNLSLKRKLAVCAIFAIGIVAPVSSIFGFVWRVKHAAHNDPTHDQALIILWAEAEMTTGIICVCLPPLPILFRRRPQNVSGASYSNSGSNFGRRSANQFSIPKRCAVCDNCYFELDDASQADLTTKGVVTTVKVGQIDDSISRARDTDECGVHSTELDTANIPHDPYAGPQRERIGNGILRTVKIEQQEVW